MIKQQRGQSILELLVAAAIVVIAFSATISFIIHIKKSTQQLLSSRSRSVQLQKVAQMILADPKLFKVNFNPDEKAACDALQADLPLAWDNNSIYDLADCPECKGRLGYVIQPYPIQSIRGVYLVTIRVSHPKLTENSVAICNGVATQGSEQLQLIVSLR